MNFQISKDYEIPERAGAAGMFQIAGLTIEDENAETTDVTNKVDQGMLFNQEFPEELDSYLSKTFNVPIEKIEIEEV